ncbi:ciliary basal body-associated B9 protein (macronuclear) [Tetrahymena thermophila SB210]|uniref:Ciliary basal body-associated B9 protein n=1 Tax=Tetrahymena thermophila (strain SB210) TaxID=312017 RepID=Q241P2_TETTS|nr:ciliary basal body-associated B9 protein [Tetrahymena thermophila SB210]EAS02528.2 ciliary basal body-associated B9 protein [Tetrahymena thermophila SB210]|eukprot:XP_001022773.2 ciliary basal body-associated B9 protein [Tetrahymena thermophila SB210]
MIGNNEVRANLIGDGFQKTPKRNGYVRMNVIGEISQAINFDNDNLYIEWEFFLPPHWQPDYEDLQENMPILSGHISEDMKRDWNFFSSITQIASPIQLKNKDGQNELITNFCFPFDIQVQTKQQTFEELSKFPILFLTLSSIDSWGRKTLQGYTYCEVPRKPGYHEITVKAWAPAQSIYQKVHEFFLGGQTKLYDIKKIAQNSILNDEVNKYLLDNQKALNKYQILTINRIHKALLIDLIQLLRVKELLNQYLMLHFSQKNVKKNKLPFTMQKDQISKSNNKSQQIHLKSISKDNKITLMHLLQKTSIQLHQDILRRNQIDIYDYAQTIKLFYQLINQLTNLFYQNSLKLLYIIVKFIYLSKQIFILLVFCLSLTNFSFKKQNNSKKQQIKLIYVIQNLIKQYKKKKFIFYFINFSIQIRYLRRFVEILKLIIIDIIQQFVENQLFYIIKKTKEQNDIQIIWCILKQNLILLFFKLSWFFEKRYRLQYRQYS